MVSDMLNLSVWAHTYPTRHEKTTDSEQVSVVELFLLDINTQQCPEVLDN